MGRTRTRQGIRISELVKWLPKQQIAFDAIFTHRYIFYGGARGPGKSYWLRWSLLLFVLYQFVRHGLRGVRVGLFCETYRDLQDRQISKIKIEFPLWLGEVRDTKEDGLCFFVRAIYGSGIIALRNLDDPSKYQSAEFAAIGVDELTKTVYDTFNLLRGSLRWPSIGHTVFLAASNPGSIGHMWVKQLWIDRQFPTELAPKANEFTFIKALPKDNPYLDQSYWDELNTLPEPLRSAWRDGNWDVFAGMAFSIWNADRHVIQPREIPAHWVKWRAIDWGFSQPFCCLWLTKDPDRGRVIVYREAYLAGLTDRQQARMIQDMTPTTEKITFTYADPSMWGKKNMLDIITTTAQEYQAEGITLTKADNDRLSGKRKIDRMLVDLPDGWPGLQIFVTCTNLIRTLPALPYDPVQVEDVDTKAEDHGYDTLRYGLTNVQPVTLSQPTKKRVQQSPMVGVPGL